MKSSDELPNTYILADFFYNSGFCALQRYIYMDHYWNMIWMPGEMIMLLHEQKKSFLHIEIYFISADSWSIYKILQQYHWKELLQRNVLKLLENKNVNWQPKNIYKYIM